MTNFSSLVNPIYCLQIIFRVMNIKRQQYRSCDAKQQSMINHIQNIYFLYTSKPASRTQLLIVGRYTLQLGIFVI